MKKLVLLLFCAMSTLFATAQTHLQDVVYLKNGSVIRGTIVEQVSGASLRLLSADGNVFVYNIADVERMTKEQLVSPKAYKVKSVSEKNPTFAGFLSFMIPGLGQFYNDQNRKGWGDFGLHLGSYALCGIGYGVLYNAVLNNDYIDVKLGCGLMIFGAITNVVNAICSICDAAISAKEINAENGYLMYSFDENCAFGLQPSLTYEMPQYMVGTKPELAAGMNFRFTF